MVLAVKEIKAKLKTCAKIKKIKTEAFLYPIKRKLKFKKIVKQIQIIIVL